MWPNPQETADLVTFTGEMLNGKLHFLYGVNKFRYFLVRFIRLPPTVALSEGKVFTNFPTVAS